jgi:hypothetical protein
VSEANCAGILQLNRKNVHSKLKRVEIIVQYAGPVYVVKQSDKKSSSDDVTGRLKGGTVESEEAASDRQLHLSTAVNAHTTTEGLLLLLGNWCFLCSPFQGYVADQNQWL